MFRLYFKRKRLCTATDYIKSWIDWMCSLKQIPVWDSRLSLGSWVVFLWWFLDFLHTKEKYVTFSYDLIVIGTDVLQNQCIPGVLHYVSMLWSCTHVLKSIYTVKSEHGKSAESIHGCEQWWSSFPEGIWLYRNDGSPPSKVRIHPRHTFLLCLLCSFLWCHKLLLKGKTAKFTAALTILQMTFLLPSTYFLSLPQLSPLPIIPLTNRSSNLTDFAPVESILYYYCWSIICREMSLSL